MTDNQIYEIKEAESDVGRLAQSIDDYIDQISESHRMHRKIRFLLDIRGLIVINRTRGDYVEFGVFRGEMMYAAARILSPHIDKYIGLDSFKGLPEPRGHDQEIFLFDHEGAKRSNKEIAATLMADSPTLLVEGDFREQSVRHEFSKNAQQISVVVIDCNWPSSVEAAFEMSAPYLSSGSIVYVDDFFVGTQSHNFNVPIMEKVSDANDLRFVEFMTYPPCGRAFLVERAGDKEGTPANPASMAVEQSF